MIDEQQYPETTSEQLEENSKLSQNPENQAWANPEDNLTVTTEADQQTATTTDQTEDSDSVVNPDQAASQSEPAQSPEIIIAALTQEIESLKGQLEEQNGQNEALKKRYIGIAAEFDNFRKRTLKEKEELEKQAKSKTIAELLAVVDNFERARTQIKPANDGEMAIHKSYQGVYKNLVDSLKRLGVSAMRPEGQPFDPSLHEAMLREETDEYPEGTVIEQLVRGYILGDQVLRHAMVKVAAPKETGIPSQAEKTENTSDPVLD